jgi:hypothetical protein
VTVSVDTLADRVLRRLGVVTVPAADRPEVTATVTAASIAASALQALGVVVPASERGDVEAITPLEELARRALEMLAVCAPDEPPLPDDLTTATTTIQALNDSMLARGMVPWQANAIPESASEDYTQLGAIYLAPAFGKAGDVTQRPAIEARIARIALVAQAQAMGETKVGDISASLTARGLIDWTEIPASAAEAYIQMTTIALAPAFGQDADPKLYAALEARVERIAIIARAPQDAHDAIMAVHTDLAAAGKIRWSVFDIPPAAEFPYVVIASNRLAPQFGVTPDPPAELLARATLARIIALPTSGEVTRAEYF